MYCGTVVFISVEQAAEWTFLSNHAHVLVCVARDADIRLRDIAELVGITERTATSIIADLEQAGILTIYKNGRRNSYEVNRSAELRHPLESHRTVGDLLRSVAK